MGVGTEAMGSGSRERALAEARGRGAGRRGAAAFVALLAASATGACGMMGEAEPAVGAVRVGTDATRAAGAVLFVDAREHGPLIDGQVIELPPGTHTLEARQGGQVLARVEAEIRSAELLDLRLDLPPPLAPAAPAEAASAGQLAEALGAPSAAEASGSIQAVVRRHRGEWQRCYERWLRSGDGERDRSVRLDAELVLGADGRVSEVDVTGGGPAQQSLRECLAERTRRWRFPAAPSERTVQVPVVFSAPGGAGADPSGTPAASPDPSGPLPATPSRRDIARAMGSVQGAVRECAGGEMGVATVRVSFNSNGRVRSADVEGSLSAPVRSCVARAVRGARVPPFSSSEFSVNYPINIR